MRIRDEAKSEAIFRATIELLNEIGFSDISMSKIAARAGVSAATIYIHFENKSDMLKKLYLNVKAQMGKTLSSGISVDMDIRPAVEKMMRNLLGFILNNRQEFLFLEQFVNSPFIENLCIKESEVFFEPLIEIARRGIREGIIKKADMGVLISYCFYPVFQLAKEHFRGNIELDGAAFTDIIAMSWDAIRVHQRKQEG